MALELCTEYSRNFKETNSLKNNTKKKIDVQYDQINVWSYSSVNPSYYKMGPDIVHQNLFWSLRVWEDK